VKTLVRFKATATCIALAILITPALLFAHARLIRSSPAINGRLSESPASLSLWFSERPELRFTSIELVDSAGTVIPHGPVTSIDSMGVTAPISAKLAPGRYSIAWRTAAADAHGTSGRFSFVVVADSTVGAAPVIRRDTISITRVGTSGANSPIQSGGQSGFSTAARWAEFVALITLIGAVVFRLLALPDADWPKTALSDSADRTRRLAGAVVVLFIIAAAMRLRSAFEMMPTTSFSGPNAAGIGGLMSGEWGVGWLFVFAGAGLAAIALLVARRSITGWYLAAFGVVSICLGEAMTGHAGSLPRWVGLSVAADVAHVLGAGGWVGGLACLVMCGIPALGTFEPVLRDVAAARLVRAYHRAAIQCVVLVVGSGLIAAWLRLGAFSDLWTTDYGSMLFRKLIFVLVVLGIGAYHWRTAVIPEWNAKTGPSFRRTAVVELIVSTVVIAFTALLVSIALPNHP
jgi:copper transport protein